MTIHFGGGELRGDQINHALEKTTTSKQIHKGCLDLWWKCNGGESTQRVLVNKCAQRIK